MTTWTWTYEDASGGEVADATPPEGFPSQAEAEAWIGESWRDLLDSGVEQVRLHEAGQQVYGPMSLRPAS